MLSKSKFILGQQCNKSFWFDINNIEPTNPPDEGSLERLNAGNEVGDISKDLFPGGVEIPYLPGEQKKMFELTKESISQGATSIYEASFIFDDIFVRVDLMNKTEKGWDIYEVKSSTRVRSYHEYDASIQWHVLKELKMFEINDVFIVTLNNEFSRKKIIDPIRLFNIDSVLDIVQSNHQEVKQKIIELKGIAASSEEPLVNIGSHCKKPHECVYMDKCWPNNMNDINSVFRLYRMNLKKKISLYNQGIDTFEKINEIDSLSTTQKNQIGAFREATPVIKKQEIKKFIDKVTYPISFFDFETFTDAVPLYDGQRPHMQMPFQYSLHVQESSEDDLSSSDRHFQFIGNIEEDPRRAIAERILQDIPKSGSIMAYNQSFEKNCIKSLASHCPDISSELLSLNERFVDLIDPFRGGGYYDHKFGGSFSIKSVLPALCPNDDKLNYKNLDINNGAMASNAYKDMRNQSKEQRILTREMLFKYCWLDTYAMYAVYTKLLELTK
jgi:hypothetical protein